MATFTSTQYGLKATGTKVSVPNNPISKLQYYLKSVLGLIQADGLEEIMNYQSSSVSSENFKIILQLCTVLEPDIFLNKCIFIAPELCGDSNNQFYEISQVTNILGVAKGVIIGGSNKKINKIMACKKEWLINNYYAPLKNIAEQIQEAQQREKAQKLLLALSGATKSDECSVM